MYNFEYVNVEVLFRIFDECEVESKKFIENNFLFFVYE